jgi:hypothetical protein
MHDSIVPNQSVRQNWLNRVGGANGGRPTRHSPSLKKLVKELDIKLN